ncbi:cupin domain-containing protein [Alloacidobacterium dinghuense]|uniref:Cupin domain-containing protein n=1 Tax=Alloacidobacterium dinghuense TaxID=2763107 RepID=A0A7G8BFH3_9BACT|nr:cupin domain-containing protein [Alloacidobacterium dinghuense]QNI31293.1 cupin domain-containing protein [Alloacidobacterium dinghuense]
MSEPVSVATAEHYVWGQVCDGWHLLRSDGLSIIEERMPAGSEGQRHWHERARQFFYVLEGELTMQFDDGAAVIRSRQGVEIAPGLPHQAKNCSGTDLRFLVVSQPPSHGDRQT